MSQNYSSANTSVNGKQGKLPALYTSIVFPKGSVIVDYGCGSVTDLLEKKAKADECEWHGYDLNWRPDQKTLDILNEGVDLAVCCNVLNVIDDEDTIKEIINNLVTHSKQTIFQIHDGNKTGIGEPTMNDCYQRNCKRDWYENLIREMGFNVTKATGKFIYCQEV